MRCAAAIAGLTALVASGCTSGSGSTYSQYFQIIRLSLGSAFGHNQITRAQAASIPYASMGWRIAGEPEHLIILATDTNGEQLWTSPDHIVLAVRGGRVVRTVGLKDNLESGPTSGGGSISPAAALTGPFSSERIADFPDSKIFSVRISCRAYASRRETIKILGVQFSTVRIAERCHSAMLNWSFVDAFWVNSTNNAVLRSIQHITPKIGAMELEILRPPD